MNLRICQRGHYSALRCAQGEDNSCGLPYRLSHLGIHNLKKKKPYTHAIYVIILYGYESLINITVYDAIVGRKGRLKNESLMRDRVRERQKMAGF